MSEKIEQLLESILEVQAEILNTLQHNGIAIRREYSKNVHSEPFSQEDKDDLDTEIDLDWWYNKYGEGCLPARYMACSNATGSLEGYYKKRDLDYLHKRLSEIASVMPTVNGGTHVFQAVGKKYCKAERNTLNCFACVPVTSTVT